MKTSLVHANVVLAARQFNPTIFSQRWLIKNGIVSDEDFAGGGECIFTPPFVQVKSPEFVLIVIAEQLQFAPRLEVQNQGPLVTEKVGRIVRLLPETPYVAVGLNYLWHIVPEQGAFEAFSRALFFAGNPLFRSFDTRDARFGGYLSKDVLGGRLRLDVKPIRVGPPTEAEERLQFAFNLHADLSRENPVDQIKQMLESWDDAREQTMGIVSKVEKWPWE